MLQSPCFLLPALARTISHLLTSKDRHLRTSGIKIVRVLEQNLESLRSVVRARKDRARDLNADYDTSRADFEAFLAEVEVEVQENKNQVALTHRALLSVITAEELSAIAKSHTKAMNAAVKTIQAI